MPAPFDALKAALADRYAIDRELGRGGMATVYLARDLRHDRPVALKVMRPELAAALGTERFLREIQISARLHHPHILPLYDSGEAGGFLFYVMPYVEGESLRDRLDRERQLPVDHAVQIAREVADALSYAHSHDVVHRDIKPENILLASGHALVADFGIARAITEAGGDRLTETGLSIGTPAYMSPEQAAGERSIDGRSDVYALGCVLYEMLVGEPPHAGPTAQAIIARRLTESVAPVRTTRDTIPAALDQTLLRALQRVPADRFGTAAAFRDALEGPSSPDTAPAPRGRPGRLPLAAGVGIVAIAVALVLFRGETSRSSPPDRPTIAVLPFENLGAPEGEYFADGITEEMTSRLAEISGLGVTSRTTTLQYKGTTKTLREIGDELRVGFVLEGTIRTDRAPDGAGQVRVTPQLIRVSDDTHLWTDRYTASLAPGEIFAVQARIAEQVAAALNITLLGRDRAALREVPTTDSAAHDAYLLGRHHWNKRTPADLERAAEHFTRATERDPAYARAWAGLADTYALFPFYAIHVLPRAEAYRRAQGAAQEAIRLDSSLAEAHASLAFALVYGSWDWDGAERRFQRALQLDSTYPVAHYWYAELLAARGRLEQALHHAERAAALAPATPIAQHILGWVALANGQVERAARQERLALELEPDFTFPHLGLAIIALREGRFNDAASEFILTGFRQPVAHAIVAGVRDPSDLPASIRTVDSTARTLPRRPEPDARALVYGLLGIPDSAFVWMEQAYRERTEGFVLQLPAAWAEVVRRDPRMHALRRRAGLEP